MIYLAFMALAVLTCVHLAIEAAFQWWRDHG